LKVGWTNSEVIFDLAVKKTHLAKLESSMTVPGFWDNSESARAIVEEARNLKRWTDPFAILENRTNEALELAQLIAEEDDEELESGLAEETKSLVAALEKLELQTMLRGADDRLSALLTIHPGAGGTESQDWAEMLLRMYTRWAERHGFSTKILDLLPGEEAGIKSVSIEINGEYAYGYLKAEKGVHRLVRISPFDAQARRHTSFASVFVYAAI